MPPTSREQLALDELLSDIYRGIETLPDSSKSSMHQQQVNNNNNNRSLVRDSVQRSTLKEYELDSSSPLVRQHKQEIAALRSKDNFYNNYYYSTSPSTSNSNKQPQRSTLKRNTSQTPTEQQSVASKQPQAQSLASFVSSSTPENKRRVRIVDHPDKVTAAKGYNDNDTDETGGKQQRVKYVNTNKLIYHQEENPDDDELVSDSENEQQVHRSSNNNNNSPDDDDVDGVTRVEYYHTTWLDRQLGRASKRRSSKELNERQVKEKAMIEELKRSLKNGAITLRQSFKGKKGNHSKQSGKPTEVHDDSVLGNLGNHHQNRYKESTVFGSGLATIPRNYHHHQHNKNNYETKPVNTLSKQTIDLQQKSGAKRVNHSSLATPNKTTTFDYMTPRSYDSAYEPVNGETTTIKQQQPQQPSAVNYSKTLPHNHNSQTAKRGEHQLLQSHYKSTIGGNRTNFNTINSPRPTGTEANIMRNTNYCAPTNNNNQSNINSPLKSPAHNQQQQQPQLGNTISSIPSATEVVRSALSRSNSQVSLNQLNKTINLLPTSPSPYPSSTTPTQHLRATSPSLSPSPVGHQSPNCRRQTAADTMGRLNQKPATPSVHFSSKTLGYNDRINQQQPVLHGTRIIDKQPAKQQQQQQQPQQQPVYANPHASLMQHRAEQQMRKGGGNNPASIREFNELDSLLRSLSPSSIQISPGYSSKPAQPAFGGYGFTPVSNEVEKKNNGSDIYARVQKQQPVSNYQAPNQQQQHYLAANGNNYAATKTHEPFTVDVTNKRGEKCLQRENLSEFEPSIELVPSMEDYQNISKLNPVKNHYWYKPNMSRDRAISLLKEKPQGTFIVRDSTSFRGAYGLAVKVAKLPKNVLNNANLRNPNADPSTELIRHFLIEPTANGVRLKGYANEPVFGSLPSLIYQHSLTELALPCKLIIPRADIEDVKFNQKQKQFFDEFVASKEQAKHSPYDQTSPMGGYRKYPGDVYVHNEHRIIFE